MTLLELIKADETVSTPETHEAPTTEVSDTVSDNRWIAGALLVIGLALAVAGRNALIMIAAALALGTASALLVFDPASERHFDRSGR